MSYVLFKFVATITGVVRVLVTLAAIVGAGYWALQDKGIELLLAAVMVLPGLLTLVHFQAFNFASQKIFEKPFRSERYRRSVNFGVVVSFVGVVAIVAYRFYWQ